MDILPIAMLAVFACFIAAFFWKFRIIMKENKSRRSSCPDCKYNMKKEYIEALAMSSIAASLAETIEMMEDFCNDEQMCDYYKRNVRINMQEARDIYGKLIFTRDWIMFKKDSKEKTEDAKEPNQEQR